VWATLFGLSADVVKQVKTDYVVHNHLIAAGAQLKADEGEFYAYKKKMTLGSMKDTASDYPTVELLPLPVTETAPKPGIYERNSELYNFFNNHPNRTPEALADLGISGSSGESASPDTLKPKVAGKALVDDKVELGFNKQGQKAARWFRRRNGGDWELVGDAMVSPLIDEAPSVGGNPEKREYRCIYLKGNKPYGQYSDIITVTTTP
jgi:hypothetical protein